MSSGFLTSYHVTLYMLQRQVYDSTGRVEVSADEEFMESFGGGAPLLTLPQSQNSMQVLLDCYYVIQGISYSRCHSSTVCVIVVITNGCSSTHSVMSTILGLCANDRQGNGAKDYHCSRDFIARKHLLTQG